MRKLVQIVGEAGAGKSEACKHLAIAHDFSVVLVSDIIRSFANDKDIRLGFREDYLDVHAQMKRERGADYVARTILARPEVRICVDGLRVINDAVRLKNAADTDSVIVAFHCPPEVRFERTQLRNTPLDRATYDEFLEDDERDAYNPDLERQNTWAVMNMADFHIDSAQPQESVFGELDAIVDQLLQRP